jgi:chorismate dehydratase
MTRVRLGAVEYLNARPLVFGLARSSSFDVRLDTPSRCAELLHAGETDLGLIPSIEYVRAPAPLAYHIVPDVAVGSRGPVASVAIFTTKDIEGVRSIALDTTSRTSVALTRVLCRRVFHIEPSLWPLGPDLATMLARCDAALIIGDKALLLRSGPVVVGDREVDVQKIDLGEVWSAHTGLPFVYAFWAGRPGAVTAAHVSELQRARDEATLDPERVASEYFGPATERVALGTRYLRDNIRYALGQDERAGLEQFYRDAAEAGVVASVAPLRFF